MTVGELFYGRGTRMSSAELMEWKVYYKIKSSEQGAEPGSGQTVKF